MPDEIYRYFLINKPFGVVSQFKSSHPVRLLTELNFSFPEGTHAIGRLDANSEGLLLLTTNKKITRLLFQGRQPHTRTYLVLVRGTVTANELEQLKSGITIKIKNGKSWKTSPCSAAIPHSIDYLYQPVELPYVFPPVTWLRITLTEGKYHQVRKMVAALHHKCLRLIRTSIEDLELEGLPPGGVKELSEIEFFKKLNLEVH